MGLFEFKIRQFSKIMKWAEMQDVSQLRQFLFDNKCCNRLFVDHSAQTVPLVSLK